MKLQTADIANILIGTAIGDAFGAGVEFQDRAWIRANVDFSCFVNARDKIAVDKKELFTSNYTAWDYTDDTEMTIGVFKALMSDEVFSEELLIQKWTEEYQLGISKKGYGRNGHGSMSWYFSGQKSIEEIKAFQSNRKNPGNAPAMRAVLLGLVEPDLINHYAAINANATHPSINAVISSQCIARAAEFMLVQNGRAEDLLDYCCYTIELNEVYKDYFKTIKTLPSYNALTLRDFVKLLGPQPIREPYFLPNINGLPSDSLYTTGAVLYVLQNSLDAMDALRKAVYLGGDVDSVASICTGIMAGKVGLDSIPLFMLEQVEGIEYLKYLCC